MGSLRYFNLAELKRCFGCSIFVETGTGAGESLRYAIEFGFERLYSTEIHPAVAASARQLLGDQPHVSIINAPSSEALATLLPTLDRAASILFWLDAHFPGADYGLAGYKDERDDDTRLPLQRELALIRELRAGCRDVILIDDLRIYEDGPFRAGNMPDWAQTLLPERRNARFVHELFAATHEISISYDHEGYLILTPLGSTA